MKHLENKQAQQKRLSGLNALVLRMTPIAAGCALLLSSATGTAFAQQAEAVKNDAGAVENVVVVTGIRRGIEQLSR
jgi:iron complex outermembrane receptor protein